VLSYAVCWTLVEMSVSAGMERRGMSRTILFLSGESMHPTVVRNAYPNPRFLARAWVDAAEAQIAPSFARAIVDRGETGTVWGIAVEIDGEQADSLTITTDDGKALQASTPDALFASGDPEAVVAAALYWELSPAYTQRLREAAGIEAPEAEGGWETPPLEGTAPPA
jgi:hypothetical protein